MNRLYEQPITEAQVLDLMFTAGTACAPFQMNAWIQGGGKGPLLPYEYQPKKAVCKYCGRKAKHDQETCKSCGAPLE